ncbi:hypothetical protein [Roseibium aggregatum]|nr:hypothetical protein [Roseibium aggregatum]
MTRQPFIRRLPVSRDMNQFAGVAGAVKHEDRTGCRPFDDREVKRAHD